MRTLTLSVVAIAAINLSACAFTQREPSTWFALSVWEGEWFNASSSPDDDVYEILEITSVDASGFTYLFRCREVPYGPNEVSTKGARASFRSANEAVGEAGNRTFVLQLEPEGRRVVETEERSYDTGPCYVTDAVSNAFVASGEP